MIDGWTAGEFIAKTEEGARPIAGWVKGVFALDFRVFRESAWDDENQSGWQLTHLPTGYRVLSLLVPLDGAVSLADEFADLSDWDFTDPAEAKSRSPIACEFIAKHPGKVVRWATAHSPLMKMPATLADQPA